ncbi:MAG TPA: hypothetical protein VEX60_15780 [Pyrinomonadaceae bacterium]|nr:hypothetical protein [Pyrinomonadaceae bacterium]
MKTKPTDHLRDSERENAPPPTGGSWTFLYAVVLGTLAALVVAFYLFTRAFR